MQRGFGIDRKRRLSVAEPPVVLSRSAVAWVPSPTVREPVPVIARMTALEPVTVAEPLF
jgi:hypothetical protein